MSEPSLNATFFKHPLAVGLLVVLLILLSYTFGNQSSSKVTSVLLDALEPPVTSLHPVTPPPSDTPTVLGAQTSPLPNQLYQVVKVTDGDTIKVKINDNVETVRVVGINTPETVDPRKGVECFGTQASHRMSDLVLNQMVRLESDPTQSDRDRYQRLLRFVFLPDGTDVGLQLISEGYAFESLYSSKPHQYYGEYVAAQAQAQQTQQGLWNPQICPQTQQKPSK